MYGCGGDNTMNESNSDERKPISWERAAVFIPLAAAAAFICSAAHMAGNVMGLGASGLMKFFTFSDVVNESIPFFCIATPCVAIALWTVRQTDQPILFVAKKLNQPRFAHRARIGVAYGFAFVGGLMLASMGLIPWWSAIGALALPLAFKFCLQAWDKLASAHLPDEIVVLGALSLGFLWGSFVTGGLWGFLAINGKGLVSVQKEDGYLVSRATVDLEKGLAVTHPFGFTLLPWGEVKSVMVISNEQRVQKAK